MYMVVWRYVCDEHVRLSKYVGYSDMILIELGYTPFSFFFLSTSLFFLCVLPSPYSQIASLLQQANPFPSLSLSLLQSNNSAIAPCCNNDLLSLFFPFLSLPSPSPSSSFLSLPFPNFHNIRKWSVDRKFISMITLLHVRMLKCLEKCNRNAKLMHNNSYNHLRLLSK